MRLTDLAWPLLALIFLLSVLFGLTLIISAIWRPPIWQKHKSRIKLFGIIWFSAYAIFILFFTGPTDLEAYPPASSSPYKLPWQAGVGRLVAQGNRSFTSHRSFHTYAWDFLMPLGTEILAARDGKVVEIEDQFDGIGFNSNFLAIEHADGQRSVYAHIQKNSALVKLGAQVRQGQPVALCGMVGQTFFPHLHFYVVNPEKTSSMPISFNEVEGGVPRAGHYYTSANTGPLVR